MIIEYQRPTTIEEAIQLLSRSDPITYALGGGTKLNRPSDVEFAVVDLQALGINKIVQQGQILLVGATATLEELLRYPNIQPTLKNCIEQECAYNLRQMRTVAGSIVAADGRSSLVSAFLALDAQLTIEPGGELVSLGNLLPLRAEKVARRLIVQLSIPLNAALSYHSVARTPADLPIVCAAAARWPSGRFRVVLGGFGEAPVLAMDGIEAEGADDAARIVYNHVGDQWASAEYRSDVAATLARRCIDELSQAI
jgi:CO/xanthine dehydrogenase FAD-binding subunit